MTPLEKSIEACNLAEADKRTVLRLLKLTAKSSRDMTGAELKAAREAAGLTLEQAAKLFNAECGASWSKKTVEVVESWKHRGFLTDKGHTAIDRIYALTPQSSASTPDGAKEEGR